jgi:methylmalonyl-CoA/ethylmalonyl-CoA epimerase
LGKRLDHIGIAVRAISDALPLYRDVLGLQLKTVEEVHEQGVRVALLALGGTHLELLEPTGPDTPVGRFIAGRGEGIHHLSIAVPDIGAALEAARAAGLRLIDERPRTGAGGRLIAFLHPKSTGGVLMELSQEERHDDGA